MSNYCVEAHPSEWLARDCAQDYRPSPRAKFKVIRRDDPPTFVYDTALRREFEEHASRWIRDTAHLSSPTKQISHPSYMRIVGMGPAALPLILQELERRARYWFPALTAITGEQPIPEGHFGNVRAMRDAWLEWGRARGYLA